jgi:hypothetical protein
VSSILTHRAIFFESLNVFLEAVAALLTSRGIPTTAVVGNQQYISRTINYDNIDWLFQSISNDSFYMKGIRIELVSFSTKQSGGIYINMKYI